MQLPNTEREPAVLERPIFVYRGHNLELRLYATYLTVSERAAPQETPQTIDLRSLRAVTIDEPMQLVLTLRDGGHLSYPLGSAVEAARTAISRLVDRARMQQRTQPSPASDDQDETFPPDATAAAPNGYIAQARRGTRASTRRMQHRHQTHDPGAVRLRPGLRLAGTRRTRR
jgi:hypothetical protein